MFAPKRGQTLERAYFDNKALGKHWKLGVYPKTNLFSPAQLIYLIFLKSLKLPLSTVQNFKKLSWHEMHFKHTGKLEFNNTGKHWKLAKITLGITGIDTLSASGHPVLLSLWYVVVTTA